MSLEPWKGQRIGNLRERVTFIGEPEIIGYDPFNEPIYGDAVQLEVSARAEPIKGSELEAAGQLSAYHEITFHCRYLANIQATWTLEWQGRTYNITGWQNVDERRRFLAVQAKAAT